MKKYTLGFIFDESLDRVLLIHKLRPVEQAGKLNGIGGKIEYGEDHFGCIVREVAEETTLITKNDEWIYLGDMGSDSWQVHVFTCIYKGDFSDAKCGNDSRAEKVEWFSVKELPDRALSNLHWLIPMALDKIKHQEFHFCSVRYI